MKTGTQGINLIKKAEGFVAKIYDDVGHPAIGYGQRLSQKEVEKYADGITEEEATELLCSFLEPLETTLGRLIKVELKQNQFDALVSFAYNIGVGNFMSSTLLKKVNNKDFTGVSEEFGKWTKSGGKELPGLVARRKVEKALWNGEVNEILADK